jgi:uncharacterized protein
VNEASSKPGRPEIPCREFVAVPTGAPATYRIPLVANARRFTTGHRIAIVLTSDDQQDGVPTIMNFKHAPVGTTSLNTVHSTSRLLLPVLSPTASKVVGRIG